LRRIKNFIGKEKYCFKTRIFRKSTDIKIFGIEKVRAYFCTPKIFDLIAQLVKHPDFIGRALGSKR